MRSRKLLLGALLAVALPASAAEPVSLLDLDLEALLQVEISGASWRESSLREAPASVTVFQRDDLQRLGIRQLHELLNFVPGVYTSRSAATGSDYRVVARGNAGTAGGALLAVDGQRVNTFQTTRPFGVLRNVPLALVERVEVIRGPGAVRFGGGPSDAVINVVTRRDGRQTELVAGSNGLVAANALWNAGVGDTWWRLNLHGTRSDGDRIHNVFDRHGRVDSLRDGVSDRTLVLDGGWRGHQVQLLSHRSDESGYYGLNGDLSPEAINDNSQDWLRYSGHAVAGAWQWQWHASRVRQRFAVNAALATRGSGPFQQADYMLRGDLRHDADNVGLVAQRLHGRHGWTLGAEWQRGRTLQADLSSNYLGVAPYTFFGGEYRPLGERFVADGAEEHFVALFAEDEWRPSESQRWIAGLRYDNYRHVGGALSPRLAWIWQPEGRHGVKVLYQQAFISPSLGHLFNRNNPVIVGNPDLEPTRVRSLEGIWTWQHASTLLSLTAYHRRASSLIFYVGNPGEPARPINAGQQDSTGLESALHWQFARRWQASLNAAALLHDRYRLPLELAEEPPQQFVSRRTASATLRRDGERWQFALGGHWRSREPIQSDSNPVWAIAQLEYRLSPQWRTYLHVDNLFDVRREDVEFGAGLGVDTDGNVVRALPRSGRQGWLGVEYHWD